MAQTQAIKEVALTFDDLPGINSVKHDFGTKLEINERLLGKLKSLNVKAIGFVNEAYFYDDKTENKDCIGLLKKWISAGMDLGNHTYSHADLHTMPLEDFEKEVLKGELITKTLITKNKNIPSYFRHPYLHTGNSLEKKINFEKFLNEHGYAVAPVTIDNSDWIFSAAYDKALAKGDTALSKEISSAYIPYMKEKFLFYENNSITLFNRVIKQVLLLHANKINADNLEKLAGMISSLGYKIIPLHEALTDEAYKSEDTYTGRGGISWLQRWAITKGIKGNFFKGEPRTPEFVMKAAGVEEE